VSEAFNETLLAIGNDIAESLNKHLEKMTWKERETACVSALSTPLSYWISIILTRNPGISDDAVTRMVITMFGLLESSLPEILAKMRAMRADMMIDDAKPN